MANFKKITSTVCGASKELNDMLNSVDDFADDLHLRYGFDDHGHSQVAAFLCMLCECVDRQGKEGLFSGPIFPYIGVLVDPISLPYLHEAVVDYVVDGHGERFVVKNPNAKTTCGCDRSFTAA